ncbi:acyltransferase [Roseomonas marmotae]|uniref:Acyltransferase n=1 Tax=Roseomonas marmotae TaxID=2768161 RepID=A0ABS3KEB6_9PROT|nr:acyltransferase [Roseomonas marmotae]MBO1075803.1 acyltransferase [Roseomonas marmotae]QTI80525.1 acyltransferase [Roseomonas marmotae]
MKVSGDLAENTITGEFADGSAVHVAFRGKGNRLEIGPNVLFKGGTINFRGSGQSVRIAGDNVIMGEIHLSGNGSQVEIGHGTKTNSGLWMNLGEADDRVQIGNDCLFANVRFRTSDSHPIYDDETGERINHSKPIRVGNRVWIAEDVLILKGSVIHDGAAIGARSLVAGEIPAKCIAVGVPARVVRKNIRWEEKFSSPARI